MDKMKKATCFKSNICGLEPEPEKKLAGTKDNRWQFFYRVGWLWLAGGLLLCTIRGRLLDCKPTFYLQSDGGSGCKRVVCRNNTPIKVAAASE